MRRQSMVGKAILVGGIAFVLLVVVIVISNLDKIRSSFRKPQEEPVVEEVVDETPSMQIGNNLEGFLADEDFFDQTQPQIKVSYVRSLSLMMNSVGQDLRIMVVDSLGNLVEGEPFSVTIEGIGDYVDEDLDGIVYLEHLRAGQYFVSLNPIDGYEVADTKNMIQVKQEIEYEALPNIRYLIHSEAEIDAGAEDTMDQLAVKEADGTENAELDAYDLGDDVGIDVSSWNEIIDWKKVADAEVDFAIIRCGYRGSSSGALVEDSKFKDNMNGAIREGLKVGVYFFTQATTEEEAIEEASTVLQLCENYALQYPIYIDTESAGGKGRADGLDSETRTAVIEAFCKTIENAGQTAGVYASKNWLEKKVESDRLLDYSIWLAEYKDVPEYDGFYDLWQYSSRGRIDGIETLVDLDVSYRKKKTN